MPQSTVASTLPIMKEARINAVQDEGSIMATQLVPFTHEHVESYMMDVAEQWYPGDFHAIQFIN